MVRLPALAAVFLACALPASGAFEIEVNYTGPAQFQSFFDDAADVWESLLVDYQDGTIVAASTGSSYFTGALGPNINTVFIDATLAPDDGVGGRLGFAGPTEVVLDSSSFILASDGIMSFDDADAQNLVNQGRFDDVVRHEMGHVLGFGTLWTNNNVYVNGSGEYTGANATAVWNTEFSQGGTPDVEQSGGPGTADGHWDEVDITGTTSPLDPTGITDAFGRDLRDELMTGFLTGQTFISQMTVASFIDIGFVGSTLAAVPEVSSVLAMGLVSAGFVGRGRRR
ncbi:MAG: peptidase [Planctomycetota bacterium]